MLLASATNDFSNNGPESAMTSGTQEIFSHKTEVADFHMKIKNYSFFCNFFVIHFRAGIWSKRAENAFSTSAQL